jgi:TonB-dependent receptor
MFVTHFFRCGVSGVKHLLRMAQKIYPASPLIAAAFCCAIGVTATSGATAARKSYDVPGGDGAATLTQFARNSGCQIVYLIENVRGEKTQPVRGEYAALDALRVMLAGTALFAVQDDSTGALVVSRKRPAPAQKELEASERSRGPPAAVPTSPPATPKTAQSQTKESPLMKKRTFIALVAGWLLAGAPAAIAQGTGTIEGRVYNAATGSALVNARIVLEGAAPAREVITDEAGAFRLSGVPAGEARVSVSYLGMTAQRASISVAAGGSVRRDFDLVLDRAAAVGDAIKVDAFTVVEDRVMSAQAISMNEQRNSPNIKNVVAIDEFGDRGAENIGEFLLFLPGVSIGTSGSEPTSVSLRGFPGNNSGLTLDGGEVATSFGGNTRSLDLREMPMNNVSRVEITKVPTPDMSASGLGGSINLISRSGFEAKTRRLLVNTYTMFHNRNGLTFDGGPRNHNSANSPDFIQPSFDFSYLHPVNRNLAFTIGGSRTWRFKPMETGTKDTDESPTWDLVRLVQTTSQWNSLAQTFLTLQGQIGIDWRFSPTDSLSASMSYRDYNLYVTRSVLGFNYGAGATGGPTFTQGAATAVGTVTMNGAGDNVDVITETKHYTLKYRHDGKVWRVDVAGSFSVSASDQREIDEGMFSLAPATLTGVVLRGDDIPSSGGTIPTRYSATRAGAVVDVYDGSNYTIGNPTTAQPDFNTHKQNLRLDVTREFFGKIPLTMKVGAAVDTYTSDQRRFSKTWSFRPNGATDAASRLASRFDVFDEAFIADSPTVFGKKVRWISGQKMYQLYKQNPSWFVLDDAQVHQVFVNNSRHLRETVSAGYLRADARLFHNRLWLVAGARYERTADQGAGPLNDLNATFQRNPDGSFVRNAAGQKVQITTDPLALSKLRYQERGATADRTYDGIYPSVNASFNLTENLILRAAYAQTLGRPNINNIIPSTIISDPDAANRTVTVNNTGLLPWSATSYDLSLESYQIKDGFGSVGVFRKNVKDFFGSLTTAATPELLEQYGLESDPSLLTYNFVTRTNAGDAQIDGLEFSYRQSLTFLPPWARGLQVFVNFTKLNLSGSNTADFSGYTPKSLAGGINFVRGRLALRWTISQLGEVRTSALGASATVPPNTYQYQAKRTRIGVNATYSLSPRYSLYASVVDWGGFTQNLLRYAPTTPDYAKHFRWQELGFYTNVGVRGTF